MPRRSFPFPDLFFVAFFATFLFGISRTAALVLPPLPGNDDWQGVPLELPEFVESYMDEVFEVEKRRLEMQGGEQVR